MVDLATAGFDSGPQQRASALCAYLRSHKIPIPLAMEIRLAQAVTQFAALGVRLDGAGDAARWLVPLLATSRAHQDRIKELIEDWLAPVDPLGDPMEERVRQAEDKQRRNRWRLVLVGIIAVGIVGWLVWKLLPGLLPRVSFMPGPIEGGTGKGGATTDAFAEFVLGQAIPRGFLLLPFILLATGILYSARTRRVAFSRRAGRGVATGALPIPAAPTGAFNAETLRGPLRALREPITLPGKRIDIRATIRGTIRAGGFPSISYKEPQRKIDCVLICEQFGKGDHIELLAEALIERMVEQEVPFVRYDAFGHLKRLRHADGRRSGSEVLSLNRVAAEYRGAWLVFLGSEDLLYDRLTGRLGELPGSEGGLSAFTDFEVPILLTVTPRARWGSREIELERAGITVLPASAEGFETAIATMKATVAGTPAEWRAPIAEGRDPFLAQLDSGRQRLVSSTPLPREDALRLVDRLNRFMGDQEGRMMLGALAALPEISAAMTRYAALFVLGKVDDNNIVGSPLPESVALRLARLPWLRVGRFPDWLREALLHAMTPVEREDLRARLGTMIAYLRRRVDDEAKGNSVSRKAPDGTTFTILRQPGIVAEWAAEMGFGPRISEGEGIFERFVSGDRFESLELSAGETRPPLQSQRIAAAIVIMTIGLGVAAAFRDAILSAKASFDAWMGSSQAATLDVLMTRPLGVVAVGLMAIYWLMHMSAIAAQRDPTEPPRDILGRMTTTYRRTFDRTWQRLHRSLGSMATIWPFGPTGKTDGNAAARPVPAPTMRLLQWPVHLVAVFVVVSLSGEHTLATAIAVIVMIGLIAFHAWRWHFGRWFAVVPARRSWTSQPRTRRQWLHCAITLSLLSIGTWAALHWMDAATPTSPNRKSVPLLDLSLALAFLATSIVVYLQQLQTTAFDRLDLSATRLSLLFAGVLLAGALWSAFTVLAWRTIARSDAAPELMTLGILSGFCWFQFRALPTRDVGLIRTAVLYGVAFLSLSASQLKIDGVYALALALVVPWYAYFRARPVEPEQPVTPPQDGGTRPDQGSAAANEDTRPSERSHKPAAPAETPVAKQAGDAPRMSTKKSSAPRRLKKSAPKATQKKKK